MKKKQTKNNNIAGLASLLISVYSNFCFKIYFSYPALYSDPDHGYNSGSDNNSCSGSHSGSGSTSDIASVCSNNGLCKYLISFQTVDLTSPAKWTIMIDFFLTESDAKWLCKTQDDNETTEPWKSLPN